MGDGKWETNGVKVNHPTPRLGFDAFESRSTLADLRSSTIYDIRAYAYMLAVYPPTRPEISLARFVVRFLSSFLYRADLRSIRQSTLFKHKLPNGSEINGSPTEAKNRSLLFYECRATKTYIYIIMG